MVIWVFGARSPLVYLTSAHGQNYSLLYHSFCGKPDICLSTRYHQNHNMVFFSENRFLCPVLCLLAPMSWLLWHIVEYFCLLVYIMIKWSNIAGGFHLLLLPEHIPWCLFMHLCHLLLKQSFMYWDVLVMCHIHQRCLHSWRHFLLHLVSRL